MKLQQRVHRRALQMALVRKLTTAKGPSCRYRGGGQAHDDHRSLLMAERLQALIQLQNRWLTTRARPEPLGRA